MQHDFNIANQGFPATRADLNNALAALASTSSGDTEPSTTYANQLWYDTSNNLLKFRNEADSAWITFAYLDQSSNEWEIRSAVIQAVDSAGVVIKTDDGTTRLTVADDGSVTIGGDLDVSGDVTFGDNDKAIFGAGSDLQIYHDGSNSYIKNNSGVLRIHGTEVQIKDEDNNETLAIFNPQGSVDLYYDNSKKLATTSTGIDVTGTVTADGLTVDGDLSFNDAGTNVTITGPDNFDLIINGQGNQANEGIRLQSSGVDAVKIDADGDVMFYEDTGTTPKFFWDASAQSLEINGSSDARDHSLVVTGDDTGGITSDLQRWKTGLDTGKTLDLTYAATTNNFDFNAGDRDLTFTTSGNILVGTAASTDVGKLKINAISTDSYTSIACRSSTGSGVRQIRFYNPNGEIGNISTSGTSTSYNTSSDYRLKENVVAITGATDRLKQLNPSRFNFIADADTTVDGFLAHEVQSIVPEAITGTKDAVDADGNPEYQGIDQSKLVPLLTAALQEALTKIDALEARITALEGV